jgi:hypothetical protein
MTTLHTVGQPTGELHEQVRNSVYGACPNCNCTLHINTVCCPHCHALFDETAAWRVLPDPSRSPNLNIALSPATEPTRRQSRRERAGRAPQHQSLAEELLSSKSVVTLEAYRQDTSATVRILGASFDWVRICFAAMLIVDVIGVGNKGLGTIILALFIITPVAVILLFYLDTAAARNEVGMRKVLLDLASQVIIIEVQINGQSQRNWHRVPFTDLRLDLHMNLGDRGEIEDPGLCIRLLLPIELPHGVKQHLTLLQSDGADRQRVESVFAALLLHTGILPSVPSLKTSRPRVRAI